MMYLRKNWRLALTLTCLGAATSALAGFGGPARIAGVPVHFTSHQLCSATFVAGLDAAEYYNEAIKPKLGPVGALLRYEVDPRSAPSLPAWCTAARSMTGRSDAASCIPGARHALPGRS